MDLSSYYQSVFYQSRDSVPGTQHSVYGGCGEMYTQHSGNSAYGEMWSIKSPNEPISHERASYVNINTQPDQSDSDTQSFSTSLELMSPYQPSPQQPKLPRIPPLAVLQQRRLAANARERKRANKINFAFNRLRKVLPGFQDTEISKFEAIQLAQDYIKQLVEVLDSDAILKKENK